MQFKCRNCTHSKCKDEKQKKDLVKRLNIIEGQINGVKQMVESGRNCDEILIQISAISKSLKSFGNTMLKTHLETCLKDDIKNQNFSAIDDVIELFGRLN